MLELKISSPSSYLDLWAWSPESESFTAVFLTFFFIIIIFFTFFRCETFLQWRKLSSNLLVKVMLQRRLWTCCRPSRLRTDQPLLSELGWSVHLEVEPSVTFSVTIVDSCFHPSVSNRAHSSGRIADESVSPHFNIINQWKIKAPSGTFVAWASIISFLLLRSLKHHSSILLRFNFRTYLVRFSFKIKPYID